MTAPPSLTGKVLGHYRLQSLIGAGGMGQVYRARDERLNRDVAIKVIQPSQVNDRDALPRFEQEARTLASLSHPNLLAVYDVGTEHGISYIVSELLEGETLRARISRERLPYNRAIDFSLQIVGALVAAHDKGIVHRDLKPENIFLTNQKQIKVLDFGIAKLIWPEATNANGSTVSSMLLETGEGRVLGTIAYMSPEQIRGEKIDLRSDIFSVGAMLFEMLAGNRAFNGETTADVISAVLKEQPPDLLQANPQLAPAAVFVVQHCLEKRREERFQSARDLRFDLTLLANNLHSSGTMISAAETRPRPTWPVWAAIACIALCGGVAVALALFRGGAARLPSYTQLTFKRGNISSARFTTDGNTVLYTASWNGSPAEIFFIRPGTTESRSLGLKDADLLSTSPAGELAILLRQKDSVPWYNRGTLARVPLAGGTPREIVEEVQTADWSPDGSSMAIVRQSGKGQTLEFPIGNVLFESSGWMTDVRISPHGDQIAFMEHPSSQDDRGWVSVVDLKGHVLRLTEEFASERGLAWSPAGKEIWFSATRSGEAFGLFSVSDNGHLRDQVRVPTSLVIHDIAPDGMALLSSAKASTPIFGISSGENKERDLSSLDQVRVIDLSDDGRKFLFQYYGEGSGSSYSSYLASTNGSPPLRLGSGSALALSHDGKWVITFDDKSGGTFLQPVGAGNVRILDRTGFFDNGDDTWCPDSSCVVFSGREADKPVRIYVQQVAGGKPVPFGPEGVTNPLISPDGKTVLALQGTKQILFDRSRNDVREVRGLTAGDRIIRWAAEANRVYLYRVQPNIQFFELSPNTGVRRLVRNVNLPEMGGIVGPPLLFVSDDGKSYVYSFDCRLSELYTAKNLVH